MVRGKYVSQSPRAASRTGPREDAHAIVQGLSEWLVSGPIQHASGGLYAWCDRDYRPSYVYPEASGYVLSALAWYRCGEGDEQARVRAQRAASFLVARIRAGELWARPHESSVIYNFDLGMIATGLLSVSQRGMPGRSEGLELARLLRDQALDGGCIKPWHTLGQAPQRGIRWSTTGTLHLAKCTQCLLLAAEFGLSRGREAARLIAESTLAQLKTACPPIATCDRPGVYAHALLYCAEGLWVYGAATGHSDSLRTAADLTELVFNCTGGDGQLPHVLGDASAEDHSDALAQLLRLCLIIGYDRSVVMPLAARLQEFVYTSGPWSAVEYTSGSGHLNTWASAFALQAYELLGRTRRLGWWELV